MGVRVVHGEEKRRSRRLEMISLSLVLRKVCWWASMWDVKSLLRAQS